VRFTWDLTPIKGPSLKFFGTMWGSISRKFGSIRIVREWCARSRDRGYTPRNIFYISNSFKGHGLNIKDQGASLGKSRKISFYFISCFVGRKPWIQNAERRYLSLTTIDSSHQGFTTQWIRCYFRCMILSLRLLHDASSYCGCLRHRRPIYTRFYQHPMSTDRETS
jgi:hypothetical protein